MLLDITQCPQLLSLAGTEVFSRKHSPYYQAIEIILGSPSLLTFVPAKHKVERNRMSQLGKKGALE